MACYSFFDSPEKYDESQLFYRNGSSPYLLLKLKAFITERKSAIQAIYLSWNLFNNPDLHEYLKELALQGIIVKVVSIPLEGYDSSAAGTIYNEDDTEYCSSVTKRDLASTIYSEIENGIPNYELYLFPHTYVRSRRMKVFSRGDLPYSLHTKSLLILFRDGGYVSGISSSNFAVRDLIKEENLLLVENECDAIKDASFSFFRTLGRHAVEISKYISSDEYSNRFSPIQSANSYRNGFLAPFYKNSPVQACAEIRKIILSASKRVWVAAQHMSGQGSESVMGAVIERARAGVEVKCLSQTSVDPRGRKPVNKRSFGEFMDAFSKTPGAAQYVVNEHLHSKYILVDNTLIVTTFNYTPTQFIYLADVNIPRFDHAPSLSYNGTFSEVGQMMTITDAETVAEYERNFRRIWSSENSIRIK